MNFSKPRFLRGEPFLNFQVEVDFRDGKSYVFEFIFAHLSIFSFYKIGDVGSGFDIFGFGVHSK